MYNKNKLQVDNAKKLATAKDVIYDLRGQWAHPGQVTRVPSPNITMKGVPYPVYGVGSNGQKQMMYPGQEYDFAGASYVDEYPQINRMRNGGILPQAQNGYVTPTYADSLGVYNNAVQQQNYYGGLKQYYDKFAWHRGWWRREEDMKQISQEHLNNFLRVSKAEREKIKKGMLSNKYYMKDMITGALDPNAPLAIYDPRIEPQGDIIYYAKGTKALGDFSKKHDLNNLSPTEEKLFSKLARAKTTAQSHLPGNITMLPYYSPLANKPATLLTNEEVKKRFKQFGPSGISKERLKSLGLIPESNNNTTTSTSRTNTPNIVKKEEPVLPEVVLDPSMFLEQQPIFDYVEPVATPAGKINKAPGGIGSYTWKNEYQGRDALGRPLPKTGGVKANAQGRNYHALGGQSQPHFVGYQRGGIASKDSLILSQNAQQALDYYKNRKYITDSAWKFDDTYDLYKEISSGYSDPNHYMQEAKRYMENPPLYKTGVNKGLPIPLSEYYKKRSPNTYYKREDKRSVLDTRSPMIMYDRRVKPQGNIFLINDIKGDPFYTDQVTFPTYDPIAITPWKNLSKEDQKKRLDIYGGAGTPFPRVKGNPDMIPQRLQDLYKYQKSNNPVVSDTTKVAPIYVESKADPRYRAYEDSLALYNRGLEKVNYWKNNPNATNIELNIKENEIDKKYPISKNADAFGTNIIKAVNMIKIGTGPSARSVPQYKKPVQPVKVKSKETVNTLKKTSKLVPKEQVLPEPVIDYSVFPEQKAIYDASWDTARYLKNLEAEQNKKAINYNADSQRWIRDPKNPNRYIDNPNWKSKPTLVTQPYKDKKQKGGAIYVTSPDDPQYQKYLATLAAKEAYAERVKFAQEQEDQTAYKEDKLDDQGRQMFDEQGELMWEEEYSPRWLGFDQPSLEEYNKIVAEQAETGNFCPGCYNAGVEQLNSYMLKGSRSNTPKHPVNYIISPEIDLFGETQEVVVRDMNKSQPEKKALRYNMGPMKVLDPATGKLIDNPNRKNIPVLVTEPYKDKKQDGGLALMPNEDTNVFVPRDPKTIKYNEVKSWTKNWIDNRSVENPKMQAIYDAQKVNRLKSLENTSPKFVKDVFYEQMLRGSGNGTGHEGAQAFAWIKPEEIPDSMTQEEFDNKRKNADFKLETVLPIPKKNDDIDHELLWTHEISHAGDMSGISPEEQKILKKYTKKNRGYDKSFNKYLLKPTETKARVNVLRKDFNLDPGTIYNENNLPYNDLLKSDNDNIQELLNITKKKKLYNLLNETSQVGSNEDLQYARYGGMMQKGGRTPIYVNDPNDPRLGAYSDSLSLYNKGEKSSGLYSMNYGPAGNHRALWRNVSNTPLPEGYTVPGTIQPVGQRITQATFPRYVLAQSPATMVGTQTDYKRRVSDIYSEPVQPVIYSPDKYDPNDPRLAAYQQAFDRTFKKEPLPEVTIDPSMFPEDKPVYDTSWNTAAYVKAMNTPQPEKRIVSYQAVGKRFKKDPKTGKIIINKDFENKPIVRQKGGVAYGTPEYAAAYRKGQVARQVGDEFLMNIPNAEAMAEKYAVTAVDPRSIDPMTGERFAMWDQLPDQYKQVISGSDPMAINARNVARLGHISADDYLAGVRDQLITAGAEATGIPSMYRFFTGEADYTDPMTYLDLLPGLGVAHKTIKNIQNLRKLKSLPGSPNSINNVAADNVSNYWKKRIDADRLNFRDFQTNEEVFNIDPADFRNFENPEMYDEALKIANKEKQKWYNKNIPLRGGYSDVPQFNAQVQDLKTLAEFGSHRKYLQQFENPTLDDLVSKRLSKAQNNSSLWDDMSLPQYFKYHYPTVFNKNYTGKEAFSTISPNKYGGNIPIAQKGMQSEISGDFITKLSPKEEIDFQNFYKTLPDNLKQDDNTYDLRGYWDSENRPSAFDYSQPVQSDGYYHAYSRNQYTDKILKAPTHETFRMAIEKDKKGGLAPLIGVDGNVYTKGEFIPPIEDETGAPLNTNMLIDSRAYGGYINVMDKGGDIKYGGGSIPIAQKGKQKESGTYVKVRTPEGVKTLNTDSEEYRRYYGQGTDNMLAVNYDGTFQGKDLEEATVTAVDPMREKYPYWNYLNAEEKRLINDSGSIGRGIRSQATHGYGINGNPTFSESLGNTLKQGVKEYGNALFEVTGIPSAYRIGSDPLGTLEGLYQTTGDMIAFPYAVYDEWLGSGEGFEGVNPLTGENYGEGLDELVDVASVIPFFKGASTIAKQFKSVPKALAKSTISSSFKPNPNWLKEFLEVKNLRPLPGSPNTPARVLANSSRLSNVEPATSIEPVLREGRRRDVSFVNDATGESGIRSNVPEQISDNSNYFKSASDRTVPLRYDQTYDDIAAEFNVLQEMNKIAPNNVPKPKNLQFDEAGNVIGYNMEKIENHIPINDYLKTNKLSPELTKDIESTIKKFHDQGYAHGDIGSNILISNDGKSFKIIDPVGYPHSSNFSNFSEAAAHDLSSLNNYKNVPEQPVSSWSMQELPGLHIKSTMSGSPLEKQLSKTGDININNLKAHIAKTEVGQQDKFIIDKVLNEKFAGKTKINYNDFRKAVSEELVPLERNIIPDYVFSNWGLDRLGFSGISKKSYESAIEHGKSEIERIENLLKYNGNIEPTIKETSDQIRQRLQIQLDEIKNKYAKNIAEYETLPLENNSITYSNSSKFGRGSAEHFDENTLGHARTLVSREEPDIMHILEEQSDYWQKLGKQKQFDLERYKEVLKRNEDSYFEDLEVLKKIKETKKDYAGNPMDEYQINQFEDILNKKGIQLQLRKGDINNPIQKEFLGKNHQERLLQENMVYAAEQGKTKMRYPTSETAAKIQGYKQKDYDIVFKELEDLRKGNISDVTKLSFETKIAITTEGNTSLVDINGRTAIPRNYKDVIADLDKSERFSSFLKNKKGVKGYDPEHQTILKKYDDFPKKAKKVIGTDVKIITDSKNNTWYEFDIPDKILKGKGEIKAFALGGSTTALTSFTQRNKKVGGLVNISQLKPTQDLKKKKRKVINSIKEAIANNEKISPISVEEINGKLKIKDGHHRYVAYKEMGVDDIPVSIKYAAAGGQVDPDEAKKMLKAGLAYRKSLTDKQRRYFAETAGTDLNGNDIDSQGNIYNDDGEIIGNVNEGEYRRGGNVLGSYQEAGQVDPVAIQNRYLTEKMRVDEANRKAAELAQLAIYDDVAEDVFDYSLPDMNCNIRGCQIASASGQTLAEDVEINKKKYSKGESVPVIPGIDQWIAESKKMGYNEIDANGLQPGDRVMIYTRDNSRLQHAVIYGGTDVDGNPVYYDDAGSGKEWRQADREFINSRKKRAFRYVGNLPSYENDYINIKDQLPEEEVTLPNKKETYGVRPQKEDMSLYENNPVNLHKFTNVINDPRIAFYNNLMNIYSKFKKPAQQKRVQYEK